MTRLSIADDLGLSPDDVPVEREEIADDEKGWQMAIELNAVRRQISGPMRRQLVEEIVDRKNWRKPSSHVTDLANMLGVHSAAHVRVPGQPHVTHFSVVLSRCLPFFGVGIG